MSRLPIAVCLGVAVSLTLACGRSESAVTPGVPDTPAGRVFREWLQAYNGAHSTRLDKYVQQHDPGMSVHTQMVQRALLTPTLGGCAGATSRIVNGEIAAVGTAAPVLRFHNQGRTPVRVYLMDSRHQWMLGRVEAGSRASLRLPDGAMSENASWM